MLALLLSVLAGPVSISPGCLCAVGLSPSMLALLLSVLAGPVSLSPGCLVCAVGLSPSMLALLRERAPHSTPAVQDLVREVERQMEVRTSEASEGLKRVASVELCPICYGSVSARFLVPLLPPDSKRSRPLTRALLRAITVRAPTASSAICSTQRSVSFATPRSRAPTKSSTETETTPRNEVCSRRGPAEPVSQWSFRRRSQRRLACAIL
jgi:hypothetical protein